MEDHVPPSDLQGQEARGFSGHRRLSGEGFEESCAEGSVVKSRLAQIEFESVFGKRI